MARRVPIGTPGLTGICCEIGERRYSFVTLVLQTCANVRCVPGARTLNTENQSTHKSGLSYLFSIIYRGYGTESPTFRLSGRKLCARATIEFPQSFPQRPPCSILPGRRLGSTLKLQKTGLFPCFTRELSGQKWFTYFKWPAGLAGAARAA